jgi:hypothetical protein
MPHDGAETLRRHDDFKSIAAPVRQTSNARRELPNCMNLCDIVEEPASSDPNTNKEEPVRVTPIAGKAKSILLLHLIARELPTFAKDMTDIEEPTRTAPNTDKRSPRRAKFLNDRELPQVAKSKTDREDPMRTAPKTDNDAAIRPMLRRDIHEPRFKKSTTETVDPKRLIPYNATADPKREYVLMDMVAPT